jgi:hypothetical protein
MLAVQQVTGWLNHPERQPSISGGAGGPLPFRERIRRAEPIPIGESGLQQHVHLSTDSRRCACVP